MPHTNQSTSEMSACQTWSRLGEQFFRNPSANISTNERIGSILAGGAISAAGFARRGPIGWAAVAGGGLLLWRGLSGRCQLYSALGLNTAERRAGASLGSGEGVRVDKSITVRRPAPEVFRHWRQLSNLPTIFSHLSKVEEHDQRHSHWVVEGPAGWKLAWDAEIIAEHPGELISWRSLEAADIDTAGSVRFESHGVESTTIRVQLRYSPPAGRIGVTLAEWLGLDPATQLENDLQKFKRRVESSASNGVTEAHHEVERQTTGTGGTTTMTDTQESRSNRRPTERPHVGDTVWDSSRTRRGTVIGIEQPVTGTVDRDTRFGDRYSVQWEDSGKSEAHLRGEDLQLEPRTSR